MWFWHGLPPSRQSKNIKDILEVMQRMTYQNGSISSKPFGVAYEKSPEGMMRGLLFVIV